jgi:hypothetical protein
MEAANAAYTSGIVFRGAVDIPIIDWRHHLEHRLDMHNSHQSFAARKRMLNLDGDASNQVIWFTDARPAAPQFDHTPLALEVIDEWLANMREKPFRGVARNKPARAVDSCFATDGSLLHSGAGAWAGILDTAPAGPCTQAFPLFSTSRIVAGGPIEGGVFKCALKPVSLGWSSSSRAGSATTPSPTSEGRPPSHLAVWVAHPGLGGRPGQWYNRVILGRAGGDSGRAP